MSILLNKRKALAGSSVAEEKNSKFVEIGSWEYYQNLYKANALDKKSKAEKVAVEALLQVTALSTERMKKKQALGSSSLLAQHKHTKFAEISNRKIIKSFVYG